MNKLRFILVSGLAVTLSVFTLSAQSQSDMRLNELLIHNETNFEDDFGFHNGWFELFNTSYGTVDIGGCFLSNDPDNLKKYIIPKGDVLTQIKPRQHILFWADNNPYHGTFHINWTSPSTNNAGVDEETKSQIMAREDPGGWILTLTAMLVVFCALIILCFIFKFTGHIAVNKLNRKSTAATAGSGETAVNVKETSGETYAAIAVALHLFHEESEAHDNESLTITMSHTDRSYSPWSSKIYTLRQTPTLKKNQR